MSHRPRSRSYPSSPAAYLFLCWRFAPLPFLLRRCSRPLPASNESSETERPLARANNGLRCLSAEVGHRVAQHAIDHRTILPRQPLFERGEPSAHGFKRRTDGLRRHNTFDSNRRARFLAREQDFLQAFPRPNPGERDVDVAPGLEARKADHALSKIDDLYRLAHVEHVDGNPRLPRGQCMARSGDHEIASLSDGHEVAHHIRM